MRYAWHRVNKSIYTPFSGEKRKTRRQRKEKKGTTDWMNVWSLALALALSLSLDRALYIVCSSTTTKYMLLYIFYIVYLCQQSARLFFSRFIWFNVVLNVNRQFIYSQNVFSVFYTRTHTHTHTLSRQFEWIPVDKAWKWAYKQRKTHRAFFCVVFLLIRNNSFDKCLVITVKIQCVFLFRPVYSLYMCHVMC